MNDFFFPIGSSEPVVPTSGRAKTGANGAPASLDKLFQLPDESEADEEGILSSGEGDSPLHSELDFGLRQESDSEEPSEEAEETVDVLPLSDEEQPTPEASEEQQPAIAGEAPIRQSRIWPWQLQRDAVPFSKGSDDGGAEVNEPVLEEFGGKVLPMPKGNQSGEQPEGGAFVEKVSEVVKGSANTKQVESVASLPKASNKLPQAIIPNASLNTEPDVLQDASLSPIDLPKRDVAKVISAEGEAAVEKAIKQSGAILEPEKRIEVVREVKHSVVVDKELQRKQAVVLKEQPTPISSKPQIETAAPVSESSQKLPALKISEQGEMSRLTGEAKAAKPPVEAEPVIKQPKNAIRSDEASLPRLSKVEEPLLAVKHSVAQPKVNFEKEIKEAKPLTEAGNQSQLVTKQPSEKSVSRVTPIAEGNKPQLSQSLQPTPKPPLVSEVLKLNSDVVQREEPLSKPQPITAKAESLDTAKTVKPLASAQSAPIAAESIEGKPQVVSTKAESTHTVPVKPATPVSPNPVATDISAREPALSKGVQADAELSVVQKKADTQVTNIPRGELDAQVESKALKQTIATVTKVSEVRGEAPLEPNRQFKEEVVVAKPEAVVSKNQGQQVASSPNTVHSKLIQTGHESAAVVAGANNQKTTLPPSNKGKDIAPAKMDKSVTRAEEPARDELLEAVEGDELEGEIPRRSAVRLPVEGVRIPVGERAHFAQTDSSALLAGRSELNPDKNKNISEVTDEEGFRVLEKKVGIGGAKILSKMETPDTEVITTAPNRPAARSAHTTSPVAAWSKVRTDEGSSDSNQEQSTSDERADERELRSLSAMALKGTHPGAATSTSNAQSFTEPSAYSSASLQAEVVTSIIQQIDRQRRSANLSWMRLKLPLSNGESISLRLRLDSNQVKVRFQTESLEIKALLRESWGTLADKTSEMGVDLEEPEFEAVVAQESGKVNRNLA